MEYPFDFKIRGNPCFLGAALAQDGISEKEAFAAAKELGTVEALESFLGRFEKGFRADLARAYIRKLTNGKIGNQTQAPAVARPQPPAPAPLASGQRMSDPNAPGVAFEVLFGHFRTMANQRYFTAGNGSYKICMQECALSLNCNSWVFQPAELKFVNQGSVDRCCLMREAGLATPSPGAADARPGGASRLPNPPRPTRSCRPMGTCVGKRHRRA
jgi:hypothetical protein